MGAGVILLAAAPSKVPFYIAGGVLAAWAVLLALRGITDSGFPGSRRGSRLVILTSAVLVAASMTTAIVTAGEEAESEAAGEAPAATGRTLKLAADPGGALSFDKTSAAVFSGRVEIDFDNPAPIEHNVTIAKGSEEVGHTETVTDSQTKTTVNLEPGEYVFFCSVTGHREGGMEGTLTVER
jgi:plastocyanin